MVKTSEGSQRRDGRGRERRVAAVSAGEETEVSSATKCLDGEIGW